MFRTPEKSDSPHRTRRGALFNVMHEKNLEAQGAIPKTNVKLNKQPIELDGTKQIKDDQSLQDEAASLNFKESNVSDSDQNRSLTIQHLAHLTDAIVDRAKI